VSDRLALAVNLPYSASDYVFGPDIPRELFLEHDRLLRDTHLRMGLAASFALSSTLDLDAGYITLVRGKNTHYGRGVSLSISRTFPRK